MEVVKASQHSCHENWVRRIWKEGSETSQRMSGAMKVEFDLRTPCYVLSTITHSKVPAEMGSAASKARKYPEAVSKVVENGVKGPSATANKMALNRLAESHKSDAIERDAADPHFLDNLNKLGPVTVDHHMQTIRPEAMHTQTLFSSRESESAQATRNRLYASSISKLLDRRKGVRTPGELERLAEEFGIDVDVLNGLAKVVNSPSIDTGSMSFWSESFGDSHEEVVVLPAVWIEPSLKN